MAGLVRVVVVEEGVDGGAGGGDLGRRGGGEDCGGDRLGLRLGISGVRVRKHDCRRFLQPWSRLLPVSPLDLEKTDLLSEKTLATFVEGESEEVKSRLEP